MTSELKCPFCQQELRNCCAGVIYTCSKPDSCPHEQCYGSKELWQELIRTRKVLDKSMKHITGLNNMLESWYKLLQSDKDTSTKYAILKSAISAYVENKGGNNE